MRVGWSIWMTLLTFLGVVTLAIGLLMPAGGLFLIITDALWQAKECRGEDLPVGCFDDGALRVGAFLLGGVVVYIPIMIGGIASLNGAFRIWQHHFHPS